MSLHDRSVFRRVHVDRSAKRLCTVGGAIIAIALAAAGGTADSHAAAQAPSQDAGRYFSLTADAGAVAVLRTVTDSSMQLLVGTGPGDLTPAPISELPGESLSPPSLHAGTDAQGRSVLVYPRCKGATSVGCDLYQYDVAAKTEQRIRGIRKPGRSEIEGVMHRGALLYSALEGASAGRGIWYRPAGGSAERRISSWYGRDLALRGKRIAYVLSDGGKSAGEEPCDNSTVVVRSIYGGPAKPIARMCEFEYDYFFASEWLQPTFYGRWLIWSDSYPGRGKVLRYDLGTGKVDEASVKGAFLGFVPTAANAGVRLTIPAGSPELGAELPLPTSVEAVEALTWKKRKLPAIDKLPAGWLRPEALR